MMPCDKDAQKTAVIPDKKRPIGFLGREYLTFSSSSAPELASIHEKFDEFIKFVDLNEECGDEDGYIQLGDPYQNLYPG